MQQVEEQAISVGVKWIVRRNRAPGVASKLAGADRYHRNRWKSIKNDSYLRFPDKASRHFATNFSANAPARPG